MTDEKVMEAGASNGVPVAQFGGCFGAEYMSCDSDHLPGVDYDKTKWAWFDSEYAIRNYFDAVSVMES
jgi:hypothetical protein